MDEWFGQNTGTLLLPCAKAARLIVEALISPDVKVGTRAKYAMMLPNLIIAGVLALVALSADSLPAYLALSMQEASEPKPA